MNRGGFCCHNDYSETQEMRIVSTDDGSVGAPFQLILLQTQMSAIITKESITPPLPPVSDLTELFTHQQMPPESGD